MPKLLCLTACEGADAIVHQVLAAGLVDLRGRHKEVLGQQQVTVILHHAYKLEVLQTIQKSRCA